MFFLISSRPSIALTCWLSALKNSGGQACGRNTPNQEDMSNLASSGAHSRMVGRSGADGLRSVVVTQWRA
jgi:hypothetical protein